MTHNIGRVVSITPIRIGPDGPLAPISTNVWEFSFTPQPALSGGDPRFVILHLTNLTLPGTSKVEVELGYSKDVITTTAGVEAWSRPINPKLGPIIVRFVGAAGGVTLAEYGSGEPWTTTYPAGQEIFNSTTNGDVFLHTDPYQEPTYQTWLECGGVFNWQNAACATSGSPQEQTARAVGMIINYHIHDGTPMVSSCSVTLIDTNLVLTARHCVADPNQLEARSGSVTFDYATKCDGAKPTPTYSPMFHKVRAIRAIGVGADIDNDWAILEIDPPPAGLVPRQLRPTAPVNGEPVFTVHHPNGAVKKFQNGTMSSNDVNDVSNLDYAGGSSGSSLFDATGKIIGAALATGPSSCNVGYSPATAVLSALANPPAATTLYDLMLVIDRSGSMGSLGTSGPGRTKMIEAREASSLFVQLVQTGVGHRMGMVSFSSTATINTPPGNFTNGKQNQLVGPNTPYDQGDIGDLVDGGSTSIGDGLQKAMTALGTLPSSANQRAILLMTDGMHNTPPSVESGESMLGNTKLTVVGFGADADLDGALMSRLAHDHNGMYTRANDGLELEKFFALAFGNIFESGSLVDPVIVLKAGETESPDLPFNICEEDRITIVVGWNNPEVQLEAIIRTPNGIEIAAGPGVIIDAARTWWFTKIELPYQGEREGTWNVRVRRRLPQVPDEVGVVVSDNVNERLPEVRSFVSVVPSGGPRMQPMATRSRLFTGDRFNPKVSLLYANGSAPYAQVELTMEGPAASIGELVMRRGLKPPDVSDEPISAWMATLKAIAAKTGGRLPLGTSTATVPLFDDGMHDDGSMDRDGTYGNPLDDPLKFEGTYTLHAVASYGNGCRGQREASWSIDVELGIDAGKTTVEVADGGSGPGGTRMGTIRLTPRDKYGSPLGPGRSDHFDVTPRPGTMITGPVTDNQDGSYSIPVQWEPATGDPGLIIVQPGRDPIIPLTKVPWWCRYPWLIWLLIAAVLALLILLLICILSS